VTIQSGDIAQRRTTVARVGWGVSSLVGFLLIADAVMKLMRLPVVIETMAVLGWPAESVVPVGLTKVDLLCVGQTGVSIFDLADMPYADWFENGFSPKEAVRKLLE
jgi:hypothetical protein